MMRFVIYACLLGAALFAGSEVLGLLAAVRDIRLAPPDPAALRALLEEERYRELDELLGGYRRGLVSARASDLGLADLAVVFARADRGLSEEVARWATASPASCDAQAALGANLARRLRLGRATGQRVPDELAPLQSAASTTLRRAIELDQHCVLAYAEAAEIATSDGEALVLLERGLDANPTSIVLRKRLWALQAAASVPERAQIDQWLAAALPAFENRQAIAAMRREASVIEAGLLARQQEILAAARRYQAAIDAQAGAPEADHLIARARFYQWLGWGDDARRDFERALTLPGDHAEVYLALARTALLRHDEAAADGYLDQALAIEPLHPAVLAQKANLLLTWRETERAQPVLEQALELGRGHAGVLAAFGFLHLRLKDYDRALDDLSASLALNPDDGSAAADHALAQCSKLRCPLDADLAQLSDFCHLGQDCGAGVATRVRAVTALLREDQEGAYQGLRALVDDVALTQH